MSRIGRKPIVIPAGVTVTVDEAAHTVAVKGPKGSLNSNYHPLMTVKVEGNEVLVSRPNDEPQARSLHKAIEACNIIAPEHLEVCVEDPFGVLNDAVSWLQGECG